MCLRKVKLKQKRQEIYESIREINKSSQQSN